MQPQPEPKVPGKTPFYRRWWFIALAAIVVLGGIGNALGLGAGSKPAATSASTAPRATADAVPSPTADASPKASACLEVPDALLSSIQSGMKDEAGTKVQRAAAVKSTDHTEAYYIAAEFTASGLDTSDVGIWATNKIDGGGMMISVDGFASQFSNYPKQDAFSVVDDGADAAKACLG